MTTNYGQTVYSQGSGTASTSLLDAHRDNRPPTTGDWQYPLGKFWVNTGNLAVYYYASNTNTSSGMQANWVQMSSGSFLFGVQTINTVPPDGTGNFTFESSDGSVTFTPIVNGLDLSVAASPTTYEGNAGGLVTPNGSQTLFIVGNNTTGINVIGNMPIHTLTVSAIQATTTQQGAVTLATSAQAIAGTDTSNAVTSSALAAKLGTQTAHSLALFEGSTSALSPLGVATNGQIPIGSTGANPVLANITSSGGTITITNGAGTINLEAAGTHVLETLTGNSGGAISPTAGNINTLGTGSITIAGSGSTLTTQLTGLTNHSLLVGAGTATITNLGVATNGQLPIGSTGADPVLATLTAGTGVSITNGAGSITISATGTTNLNYTSVNHAASPYTVLSTDDYIGVDSTAGAVTILLPNSPATGKVVIVKDSKGQAVANNITVTTVGGVVTFDGTGNVLYLMATNYQADQFIFNGTSYEVF